MLKEAEEVEATSKENYKIELELKSKSARTCPLHKQCEGKGNTKNGVNHYVIYNCPFYNEVII